MSKLDPCLAVIPARGGSKGLPGKNIRPLAGLPLIVHAIKCASHCSRIARCIVSTDSEEIAQIARQGGGDVPFLRPAELARDETPTMPVLVHALDQMESRSGTTFGSVLLLEPTSPGRLPQDIDKAFALLDQDEAADGVVACSRPSWNPFYVGVVEKDGALSPAFPASLVERRQDAPTFWRINGALYLWRRDFVRRPPTPWLKGRHRLLDIPEQRALSIDDLYEFQLAEWQVKKGLVKLPWLT